MRRLYLVATLLFWLLLAAIWAAARWLPGSAGPAAVTANSYSQAEVARHATPEDCWMAIRGDVYDLSAYLPEHPARPALVTPWCGREATDAYNTKNKGRAHSPAADELLTHYKIGRLTPANR